MLENLSVIINPNAKLRLSDMDNLPRNLPCLLGWKDRESRYLGITNYLLNFCGIDDESLIRYKKDSELEQFETYAKKFYKDDQMVMNLKQGIYQMDICIDADNQPIPVMSSKHPIYDENYKKVIGLCFMGIPINHYLKQNNLISADLSNQFTPLLLSGSHYKFISQGKSIVLSKSQSHVLYYYLRGRTSKEIANVLNISSRTVESYIETIKYKMHASTRSDIIDMIIHAGLFDFVPNQILTHRE